MNHRRPHFLMNDQPGTRRPPVAISMRRHAPTLSSLTAWWVATIVLSIVGLTWPALSYADNGAAGTGRAKIDFNEVEFLVLVKFMSDLTHKTCVVDETVKKTMGKISLNSPDMVTVEQAYNMFLATLAVNRLTTMSMGNIIQIVQQADVPPERSLYVYKLKHANATDVATIRTTLATKGQIQQTPGARPQLRPAGEFDGPIQVLADKATNSGVITAQHRPM